MPALIFDLDGTLVDTVYAHVFAWQRAFARARPGDRRLAHPPPHRHERGAVHARRGARARARDPGGRGARAPEPPRRAVPRAAARAPGAAGGARSAGRPARARDRARHRHLRRRPDIDASLEALGVPDDMSSSTAATSSARSPSPTSSSSALGASAPSRPTATSSATRCGTCSPRGARACSRSACCPGATARTSSRCRRVPGLPGPGGAARSRSTSSACRTAGRWPRMSSGPGRSVDQPSLHRPAAELVAVGELELAQHGGDVGLDRLDRDPEPLRDLLVEVAAGDVAQDLALARR